MRHQAKPFSIEVKRTKKLAGDKRSSKPQGWADAHLERIETAAKRSSPLDVIAAQPRTTNADAATTLASRPLPRRILPDLTATALPTLPSENAPESVKRISRRQKSAVTISPSMPAIEANLSSQRARALSKPVQSSEPVVGSKKRAVARPAKVEAANLPAQQPRVSADTPSLMRKARRVSPWRSAGAIRPGERWRQRLPAVCR